MSLPGQMIFQLFRQTAPPLMFQASDDQQSSVAEMSSRSNGIAKKRSIMDTTSFASLLHSREARAREVATQLGINWTLLGRTGRRAIMRDPEKFLRRARPTQAHKARVDGELDATERAIAIHHGRISARKNGGR